MSDYEAWMKSEQAVRKQGILNCIRDMRQLLDSIEARVNTDGYLNDLGELQVSGIMLDTSIVAYATQRQALKNYQGV
jgi:hypothetical protein